MQLFNLIAATLFACASSAFADPNTSTRILITATQVGSPEASSSIGPSPGGVFGGTDYFNKVCAPVNSTGQPDLDFPCNIFELILFECIYGTEFGTKVWHEVTSNTSLSIIGGDGSLDYPQQYIGVQRTCACEHSNFFDELNGCAACSTAHGADDGYGSLEGDPISDFSSAYCAATATPTIGLAENLLGWAISEYMNMPPPTAAATSDPLSASTAVSLYYTASATGSEAWLVISSTGRPKTATKTQTSTMSAVTTTHVSTESSGEHAETATSTMTTVGPSYSTTTVEAPPPSSSDAGESSASTTAFVQGAAPAKAGTRSIAVVNGIAAIVAML